MTKPSLPWFSRPVSYILILDFSKNGICSPKLSLPSEVELTPASVSAQLHSLDPCEAAHCTAQLASFVSPFN